MKTPPWMYTYTVLLPGVILFAGCKEKAPAGGGVPVPPSSAATGTPWKDIMAKIPEPKGDGWGSIQKLVSSGMRYPANDAVLVYSMWFKQPAAQPAPDAAPGEQPNLSFNYVRDRSRLSSPVRKVLIKAGPLSLTFDAKVASGDTRGSESVEGGYPLILETVTVTVPEADLATILLAAERNDMSLSLHGDGAGPFFLYLRWKEVAQKWKDLVAKAPPNYSPRMPFPPHQWGETAK